MRHFAATALAVALLQPAPGLAADGPKVVHLKTQDGLTLEADWYQGDEGMPGILGLHMYPADRTSWKPLAEKRPAGFHFLAVDLRGYGGSRMQDGKDLSERVKARDPQLFQSMWQDAVASVKFLRGEAKCDTKRIGIVGASVGCSLAIDTAVRDGKIAGVACLSPGTNYFGIPSIDHVRSWPAGTALFLASPEGEAAGGTAPLSAELKGRPEVEVRNWAGGREFHGTSSFGKEAGLEGRLLSWFKAVLGREVLDGMVDTCEESRAPMPGEPARGDFPVSNFRIGLDAKGVSISAEVPEGRARPPAIELRVETAEEKGGAPTPGARRLRGEASGDGTLLRAWLDTWKDGKWSEQPLGNVPGTVMQKGRILEARVPWGVLGGRPVAKVWIRFLLAGQDLPVVIEEGGMEVPE